MNVSELLKAATKARGQSYAPYSGGEVGAKAASLTIMVGGTPAAFERVKPLFSDARFPVRAFVLELARFEFVRWSPPIPFAATRSSTATCGP